MRSKITLLTILTLFILSRSNAQEFQNPIVPKFGRVAKLDQAVLPTKGASIIIDLTSGDVLEEGVNKAIARVARLVNLYAIAGISKEDMKVSVILHGSATKAILKDEIYKEKYQESNPDIEIINLLRTSGVEFMVCSQSVLLRGYDPAWVNPDITFALSAITALVDYKQRGFQALYF